SASKYKVIRQVGSRPFYYFPYECRSNVVSDATHPVTEILATQHGDLVVASGGHTRQQTNGSKKKPDPTHTTLILPSPKCFRIPLRRHRSGRARRHRFRIWAAPLLSRLQKLRLAHALSRPRTFSADLLPRSQFPSPPSLFIFLQFYIFIC
ncbi:unnamed protein product, partial [Musa banksii]